MKEIPLSNGRAFAFVDDEDFDRLNEGLWYYTKAPREATGRARGRLQRHYGPLFWMHRVVLDAPPGAIVDHIDGNALNNQRSNLRIVTAAQNAINSHKPNGTTSRYIGVTFQPDAWGSKKWRSSFSVDGRKRYVGHFLTEEEAAQAADEARRAAFGPFARYNFPREGEQSAFRAG